MGPMGHLRLEVPTAAFAQRSACCLADNWVNSLPVRNPLRTKTLSWREIGQGWWSSRLPVSNTVRPLRSDESRLRSRLMPLNSDDRLSGKEQGRGRQKTSRFGLHCAVQK